jgi:hypothetical protein
MNPCGRLVVSGAVGVLVSCALSSRGSSPAAAKKTAAGNGIDTATTTTTTVPSTPTSAATTTTGPGVTVPPVIGLKIAAARAAPTWACYSVGRRPTTTTPTTTTTTTTATTTPTTASSSTSTTAPAVTVTTPTVKSARPPETVLTQNPAPGTVRKRGSIVSFTMQVCPR